MSAARHRDVTVTQAMARCVIGEPSYFPSKVRTSCHIVRVLALMKHPLHGAEAKSSVAVLGTRAVTSR